MGWAKSTDACINQDRYRLCTVASSHGVFPSALISADYTLTAQRHPCRCVAALKRPRPYLIAGCSDLGEGTARTYMSLMCGRVIQSSGPVRYGILDPRHTRPQVSAAMERSAWRQAKI